MIQYIVQFINIAGVKDYYGSFATLEKATAYAKRTVYKRDMAEHVRIHQLHPQVKPFHPNQRPPITTEK